MDYLNVQAGPSGKKAAIAKLREAYFSGTPLTKSQRRLARKLYRGLCGTSNGYIAPHIRQVNLRKQGKTSLYDIEYVVEGEYDDESVKIRMFSDTTNPDPKAIKNIAKYQRMLKQQSTDSEMFVKDILDKIPGIRYSFQQPFYICEKMFFADFYIHSARMVIEIDGGVHNIATRKLKDTERTAYLNSVGVQVIRFTNEEVLADTIKLYEAIAPYVVVKKRRTVLAEDSKNNKVKGRKLKKLHKRKGANKGNDNGMGKNFIFFIFL